MAAADSRSPLSVVDPFLADLIEKEKSRQWQSLECIASENFTSRAVLDCLGSPLTNKYSEGYPGKRYYGGNNIIDQVETLCQTRALAAYGLNPDEWGVNVQPYSGSPANFAVYTALLKPHERIMGLDLPSGGHLTHGFYTVDQETKLRKAVSATSIYFESLPYRVDQKTGLVDFEAMASLAALFKPAMLIAGGSAYPRDWDYASYRKIADDNGSLLMMDMAHISGLVATGEAANPFNYCDIVTTTCHKTMRGPRAGMIFYKKDARNFGPKIDQAVFPSLQGGPHEHQIAGIATQLREVATPEFKAYIKQVKANAACLGAYLMARGYTICTGGTDNHMILWDLRPQGMTGSKFEKVCDLCHITLNKNTVPGDKSAGSPGGVRIGAPALTTRGFKEADFEKLGELYIKCLDLALRVQATSGKMLKDFVAALEGSAETAALKAEVFAFATSFPMPGFEASELKYKELM